MIPESISMVEASLPTISVGRLAFRVQATASSRGDGVTPKPAEIFHLLLQLLQIVFGEGCNLTPKKAAVWLNSTRLGRERNIRKITKRQVFTSLPQYPKSCLDNLIDAIVFHARICTEVELESYLKVVRGFQDY